MKALFTSGIIFRPMVFSGIYPIDTADYEQLKFSMAKLQLNDAAFVYQPETSAALGFGFRCGFLGLLHMEIIQERLRREYNMDIIATYPSVIYHVYLNNGTMVNVDNPVHLPDPSEINRIEEPLINAKIMAPTTYMGDIMNLIMQKRGICTNTESVDGRHILLTARIPMHEILIDFHDKLKSITRGYGSMDYEPAGYQADKLVKLDMLVNGEPVDAFSTIVHADHAYNRGRMLAEKLAGAGLDCYYQTVVGDNVERLAGVLKCAMERSDVILLSGGLGPTEDDLTKETVAKVCGKKLSVDDHSMERIAEFFAVRDIQPTENNWKQAMVPEGAKVLDNDNGTAPGIILETEKNRIVLLPGPPAELIPMFDQQVLPYLDALTPGVICSQMVKLCGVPESQVEDTLKDLIDGQTNPTIATYAKTGEVHIRVTASGENAKAAGKTIKPIVKELKSRFGGDIYSTREETTLEMAVADLLLANDLTVTTAESCTGGMIAARIINVPGVSECYKAGLVTYSNKAKRKFLGVRKSTLDKYGAVSSKTAGEMAKGAALLLKADVAVAVTGIAGPDGGTEEKPVGLVYIGCCVKGELTVKEYHFSGTRSQIREATTSAALILMRSCILKYFSKVTFGKK